MNWIYTLSIYTDEKDWVRAWTVESNRLDAMFQHPMLRLVLSTRSTRILILLVVCMP